MQTPNGSPPPADAAAAVPSLRTLGTGATQAAPGNILGTGTLALTSTSANVITSATTDANTSPSVAALTLKAAVALTSGDLILDVQKSTGGSVLNVDTSGNTTLLGSLTTDSVAARSSLIDLTGTGISVIRTNAVDANTSSSDAAMTFWAENAITSGDLLYNFTKSDHSSVFNITDVKVSVGVPALALASTSANTITSATTDANTSSSVAALTLKSGVALTAGDLVLNVTNSADTSLLKVDTAGLVTAASGVVVGAAGVKFSDATVQTTAAAAAGAWTTAFNIDLAAQGSQALNANTTYTIDSVVFTKFNSANDSTAMALTNGAGIVMIPASASDWYGGTHTAPGLSVPLSTVIPSFTHRTPFRVWTYVSAQNFGGNYDNLKIGLRTATPNGQIACSYGSVGGAQAVPGYISTFNGSGQGFAGVNSAPFTSHNVILIEFPEGVASARALISSGVWSAGWPTSMFPVANIVSYGNFVWYQAAMNTWLFEWVAQRAGSGTALSVTIANIKMEYKPGYTV